MKSYKNKYLILFTSLILALGLAGCGNTTKQQQTKKVTTKTTVKHKEKTQAQLNQELKSQATQANFIEINGHTDKLKGKKVFAVGQISAVDYNDTMDNFPSFTLSQKEGDGYGVYHITNILSAKGLKDGDTVKIYGDVYGTTKDGMPKINATVIEKQ